ncbi:MAG: hypothetical protein H0X71_00195 [Rubrobacter sp.]|nr:hypothetical protein [Rubrobacter sp.]
MSTKDPTTDTARQSLSRLRFLTGTAALVAGGALLAAPKAAEAHTIGSPTDIAMLDFALTLEHLETNFYAQG